MTDFATRRARIEPLLEAARTIADPEHERGRRARTRFLDSSGLSAQGVEFALERCLETHPSERELEMLIRSTPSAQVAHLLLSANVFVAAHRAIAIALAASDTVRVRASRREPDMAELLLESTPNSFRLVSELSARAGDRLWAYGSDDTLDRVAVTLAPGVALHAHGAGFGVAVIDGTPSETQLALLLTKLAEDTALFDQRGCLSPRLLLLDGSPAYAREVGQALAEALAELETRVPTGRLSQEEAAEVSRYRATANFIGEVRSVGSSSVSVGSDAQFLLAPSGRNLHVLPTTDVVRSLSAVRPMITSCAYFGSGAKREALRRSLPGARLCEFGDMQRPPFDGPADRRDL